MVKIFDAIKRRRKLKYDAITRMSDKINYAKTPECLDRKALFSRKRSGVST